ncbi:MAG: phosphatidylglycerophosphatase A family protein [Candidatus Rifleibacteriota bacterium]
MTISKRTGTNWTSSSRSNFVFKLLGTCFGLGYLPGPNGAWGSLFGIALYLLTKNFSSITQGLLLFFIILMAIGISEKLEKILKTKDPEEVIIDEAVGMWVGLLFIWNVNWLIVLAAFILFRLFDGFKPFPLNLFQTFRGGVGIMADDIAAGMITNFIIRILIFKGVF